MCDIDRFDLSFYTLPESKHKLTRSPTAFRPETIILGAKPGTCFVNRNIANLITVTNISATSVIEYAVNALRVKHMTLCGHTGCGVCKASLRNAKVGKIDTWLMPLRQLRLKHAAELEKLEWEQRSTRFAELNVMKGVEVLRQNPDVIQAIKDRDLTVHGVIYDLKQEFSEIWTYRTSMLRRGRGRSQSCKCGRDIISGDGH